MQPRDDLDMDVVVDPTDSARQYALGGIVLESAYMEHLLRAVFTALLGNKNGAVVAAGQNAGWLLDQCQAMTKALQEISEDDKDAVLKGPGRLRPDLPAPEPSGSRRLGPAPQQAGGDPAEPAPASRHVRDGQDGTRTRSAGR